MSPRLQVEFRVLTKFHPNPDNAYVCSLNRSSSWLESESSVGIVIKIGTNQHGLRFFWRQFLFFAQSSAPLFCVQSDIHGILNIYPEN